MSETNQETALYELLNELIEKKIKDNKDLTEFAEDIIYNLKQVYLYNDLDFKSSEDEEEEEEKNTDEHDEIIIVLLNQIKKLEKICSNLIERKSKYITKIIAEKKNRYKINNSTLNRKEKVKAREVCNYTIDQLNKSINFEYDRIGYIQRRIREIKDFKQDLETFFNHY